MHDKNTKQIKEERFPSEETMNLYDKVISTLFDKAEKQDEKEFMSSILYFTGIMTFSRAYNVSLELQETIDLFFKLSSLRNKNQQIFSLQNLLKFGLLVYCHIIETYPTFEFLYNLSLLAQGKNYELQPFGNEEKSIDMNKINHLIKQLSQENNIELKKKLTSKLSYEMKIMEIPVIARIEMIAKESKKAKIPLGDILVDIYDKDIRNAFSHGLYGFDNRGMTIIRHNKHISYRDLLDKITKCLHFYIVLAGRANEILQSLPANKESKFVGRLGEMSITPNYEGNSVSYQIQSTSMSRHI